MNHSLQKSNKSGQSGVSYLKDRDKWRVRIKKPKIFGHFQKDFIKKEMAIAVSKAMYVFYGYPENHGKECPIDYDNGQKRRTLKSNQTPNNVNKKLMKAIYDNCPKGWHVDHIHPLSKGGLNEPNNLQYLTQEDNNRKSAKLNFTDYITPPIRWQDVINKEEYMDEIQ
jgi:hypothetical protein